MKQKTLVILCCIALTALCGCSPAALPALENTGRRAAPATATALPADGYALTVAGAVIKPPMPVAELESLGFSLDEPDAPSLAPLAVSDPVTVTGRGTSFVGRLYNPSNKALAPRDCLLIALCVHRDASVGDIATGSGKKEVSAAYGDVDEGIVAKTSNWMMYGTWLYYGLGFEIDNRSQRVISIVSFCKPLGETEAKLP